LPDILRNKFSEIARVFRSLGRLAHENLNECRTHTISVEDV